MPLARYRIRNEFSLADPELYRAADRDDPEALLEGVAMAGLVGVLRQLGDLAQFATEVFHDLHEEVMATAARGHGLMVRVQQLEAEVPSLEKAFLSQTHHSSFFSNAGIDWHPNLRSEQNLITGEDLPRFVMDSYEDCRGPPRLFLLDKFDVAGAGACLKRYTDPSFLKLESASSKATTFGIHREKRSRRLKKKAARLRNGETPEVVPTHAKLHQLLLEERVENSYGHPARLVKLKKRQLNRSGVGAENGRSFMEKFLESPSPDYKMVKETSMVPLPVKSMSEDTGEARIKILEISTVSPVKRSLGNENPISYSNEPESELKSFSETKMETNGDLVKVHERMLANTTDEFSNNYKTPDETELADDEQKKLEACLDCYHSEDATSEVDNYVDALTTMESEMDTDNESRPKNSFVNGRRLMDSEGIEEHHLGAQFSNSQSFGDSSISDESISFKQDRGDERNELQAQLSDSQSIGTSSTLEENSSFKRYTGEEHMHMHAQFSDSQSVGNSSASEEIGMNKKDTSCFSHIESFRTVEDIKSEPLSLPSTKHCAYEIENTHSDHLPQSVKSQKPDCNKFVMHDDAEFQEEEISDSGQTTADSCLMHSAHLVSDAGVNPSVIQPTESQIIQTSDTVDLHSTSADTGSKCLVEPNAIVVPDSVSTVMDDACPVSSEKYPLSNLDDGDPCAQSEDSIQRSIVLELAPMMDPPATLLVEGPPDLGELHSSLAAVPDALSTIKDGASPVRSSEEYPLNKLDECDPYVHCDASLPVSNDLELTPVIPTGTKLVETPSEPVKVEDDEERKCQVESIAVTPNAFSLTKDDTYPGTSSKQYSLNLDNSEPYVHSGASQHISNDLNWASRDECRDHSKVDILQDGLSKENYDESLASKGVNSPQGHSPFMEVDLYSGAALPGDGAEIVDSKDLSCIIASRLDCQGLSPAVETPPASSLTSEQFSYVSHGSPVHKPDSVGVEVLYSDQLSNSEETLRIDNDNDKGESTCRVDAVDNDDHLIQPSSPGFMGQGNCVNVHNAFTERVQSEDQAVSDNLLETFPVSSDSYRLKVESSEAESSEIFRDVNAETKKNKLEPSSDIVSSEIISSSLRDPLDLEESPSSLSNPHVKEMLNEAVTRESLTELEVQKAVNHTDVASADVGLCLNRAGSHDLSDSEASANDLSMVPEFSEPGTQELESSFCQNNSLPSPSHKQLVIETPVQLLQSEAFQQGVDFPLRVENSALEKFQSELHVSRQLGQERRSLAASEAAVEIHLDQPSSSDSVSHSDGQELNIAKHVMDPLKPLPDPIIPGSAINLGEMPPMPPLPPMQWRKGKVQHASKKEVIEVSQASFQPIQTIKTDERGQFGSTSSERETLQYQNTFLPLMAVEGDKIPYSSGFSAGFSGHPVTVPFKFPFMVNEANGQYNYLVLERSQMQNPFLTLPMVSTVKPSHGLVRASEGEIVQCSSLHPPMPSVECASGYDPVSSQEKLAQPLGQLIEETTSEAKERTRSVSNLEGEQKDPSMTFMPPPSMKMVQHNHGLHPSEGEMASSLGHDPVSSQEKLAQPPSQLIEETTSEAKEPSRSVSNLEGEQEDHSMTSMPPPSMEMVQHNHGLPPSEGQMASSLGHDPVSSQEKLAQPPSQLIEETTLEAKEPTHSVSNLEGEQEDPSVTPKPPPSMGIMQHNHSLPPSEGEMMSSLDLPTSTSIETEGEKPNAIPKNKLPRPRNPLIDAVAAHDKSKLRKVTERSRPETAPKIDERDSLLEQIRTKSFNLKPAAVTRPSIGGPKTNLKVAAILEKASAIRQALAGSDDEDDDADSWSDS